MAMRKAGQPAGLPSAFLVSPKPSERGVMPRRAESSTVTATARPAIASSVIVAGTKTDQLPDGAGYVRARVSAAATIPPAKNAANTPSTSRYARRAEIGLLGGGGWMDHQCGLAGLPTGPGQVAGGCSVLIGRQRSPAYLARWRRHGACRYWRPWRPR